MHEHWRRVLEIRTPEGIAFAIPLAGAAARFLAWLIDCAVYIGILSALAAIVAIIGIALPDFSTAFYLLGFFLLGHSYNIVLEWFWRGQTIGKRILRIRVIDIQGLKLQFTQVVIRNLFRSLDAMPLLYLAGGAALWISARHQRLGDLAANTLVIRQPRIDSPDFERAATQKYNSFEAYPHIEARLRQQTSPEEAALALEALLRRDHLEPGAAVTLFRELAAHFREKAAFPEEATFGLSDEQYLRNVVATLYGAARGKPRRPSAAGQRGQAAMQRP